MSHYDPNQRHLSKGQKTLQRLFPERQVMVRSAGRLRSVRFSTAAQLTGTAVAALLAGWVGFSSFMVLNHESILASKQEEVARARSAYQTLLAQVSVYRDKITQVTEGLENNHARAVALLQQNESLDQRLQAIEDELASSQEEQRQTQEDKERLVGHLQKIRAELQEASEQGEAEAEVASLAAERAQFQRERETLRGQLERLEQQITDVPEDSIFASEVDSIEVELRKVVLQRDLARSEGDSLREEIAQLQERLASMQDTQTTLTKRFTAVARERSADIEEALSGTGLKLEDLLKDNAEAARGGPFIPLKPDEWKEGSLGGKTLVSLNSDFEHWNALQVVLESLPLGQPLKDYRITSGFGRRSDPVNGLGAVHQGLDMAAPFQSPVFATGPGKVTFAGWRGRYGRMIEIDHGNGIKTRYGHLNKILVRKGDRVDRSTRIALLGSSGRSTGPHVHYEVVVEGKPRNPINFIKAGVNVL
jgi:murein DD-endopeptidase MepM/ murein hydrolase activator NlpD